MPRIPYRFPNPGESSIADSIRARRGARGLTSLDGTLLNAPEIANGWNTLLKAVRTGNSLPDDIRELMILRVAARNSAYFEWLHHEPVGRSGGLTTPQLSLIRDISLRYPFPPSVISPLSALQAAALAFADAMTLSVQVPDEVFENLKGELGKLGGETGVEQKITEAAATVATYNMVSRFLVSMNVEDSKDVSVPFPGMKSEEYRIKTEDGCELYVLVNKAEDWEGKKWILFVNSLLTDLSMWDGVVAGLRGEFNVIRYDQRGHGKSSIPPTPCTIPVLSSDISTILHALSIPLPLHCLIGISQGGATSLSFPITSPSLTTKLVACDTQSSSPAANKAAWDERIELARKDGMAALAEVTVKRWFPIGSDLVEGNRERLVRDMIIRTPLDGFIAGARALQSYDLDAQLPDALKGIKTLLIAGERDGKLPEGLEKLAGKLRGDGRDVEFYKVPGSGHLPPLDQTRAFTDRLREFLKV